MRTFCEPQYFNIAKLEYLGPTASLDPEALLSLNSGTRTQPRFPTDGKNIMSAFDPSIYGQPAKFDVHQQKNILA